MFKRLYEKWYHRVHSISVQKAHENLLYTKIGNAFARASATAALRNIDLRSPLSWEFSGFSQNGEDGILDVLIGQLKESNRYFLEIGANNCIDNNTAWLGYARNFSGVMIEGDPYLYKTSYAIKPWYVNYHNMFVDAENILRVKELLRYDNPDVFSLDIDGNDYYIAKSLLEAGVRPKIIVAEYNSAFGPEQGLTIQYEKLFSVWTAHSSHLYYGVSVSLWRKLFGAFGYRFVTVESNGVNAFFIHSDAFEPGFMEQLEPVSFKENAHQLRMGKGNWKQQFALIQHMPFNQP